MTPWTMGKVKPPYKASLLANLRHVPLRFRASGEGLTLEEAEKTPVEGKWSSRQCIEHVALVDLGWTDILYEAVCPYYPHIKQHEIGWSTAAQAKVLESIESAFEVLEQNHKEVVAFLDQLPEEAFTFEHNPVQWLVHAKIPFVIKESVNWGLSVHVDWHLIHIHQKRVALGKPLAWMANIRTD